MPAQLNRYQLQVTIEPELHSFQGVLHLDYTNTEETSLDSLFFRLLPNGQRSYGNGSLDIDWVRLNELDQSFQLSLENTVLELKSGAEPETWGRSAN